MEDEKRKELVDQGKQLKDQLAVVEENLDRLEAELQAEGQKLPNLTHPDVSSLQSRTRLRACFTSAAIIQGKLEVV